MSLCEIPQQSLKKIKLVPLESMKVLGVRVCFLKYVCSFTTQVGLSVILSVSRMKEGDDAVFQRCHGWPHKALGPFLPHKKTNKKLQYMHTVQNALITIFSFLSNSNQLISFIQMSNQVPYFHDHKAHLNVSNFLQNVRRAL